jgi:hypothetical protein
VWGAKVNLQGLVGLLPSYRAEIIREHLVGRAGYAREQRMIDDSPGIRSIRL